MSPVTDLPLICNGAQIVLVSTEGERLLNGTPCLHSKSHSEEERARIARSIVKGLAFLHSKQIFLGNNLVPDNILILGEKEGIQTIFRSEMARKCNDPPAATREDLRYLSNLLVCVWGQEGKMEDLCYDQQVLVSKLKQEPSEIHSMDQMVHDVAFWSSWKAMEFLISVSEVLELKQVSHRRAVEADGHLVVGMSWINKLDPVLRAKVENDSMKRRNYDWTSVVDLLRVIRNLACHYFNLTPEVRHCLGSYEDLGQMWTSLFPQLLSHVHGSMKTFYKDTNCNRIHRFFH